MQVSLWIQERGGKRKGSRNDESVQIKLRELSQEGEEEEKEFWVHFKFSGFFGLRDTKAHSPSLTPVWWQFLKHSIKYRVDGRLLLLGEGRFKDGSFIHEGGIAVRTSTFAACLAVCVSSASAGLRLASRSCVSRTPATAFLSISCQRCQSGSDWPAFIFTHSLLRFIYLFIHFQLLSAQVQHGLHASATAPFPHVVSIH